MFEIQKKNKKQEKPLTGVLVAFKQIASFASPQTGLTFYSLPNGQLAMQITKKGYIIPMPEDIEDNIDLIKKQKLNNKKDTNKFSSSRNYLLKFLQIIGIKTKKMDAPSKK